MDKELNSILNEINKLKENIKNVESEDDRAKIIEDIKYRNRVVFEKLATYRKNIGLLKVENACDFIEDVVEQGQKIVVFCHHHEVEDKIAEYLEKSNIKYVRLSGDVAVEKRGDIVKKFMEDETVKVFIGGIRSASEGITLTAASIVLMVEYDLNPMKMLQAEDRCNRIGQKANSVNVYWLSVKNSFDDYLLNMVVKKIDVFERGIVGDIKEEFNLVEI
jgi:SNF2 family DNA or RNA helicase